MIQQPATIPRRVLNLGAGTQSSVLLIMADRGEIPPVEVAIFADTQAEPREVYDHLAWLEKQVKNTPIVKVTHGNLRTVAMTPRVSKKTGNIWAKGIPYWTRDESGKLGLFRNRACTVDFKITPINRWIRKNIIPGRLASLEKECVTRVFGISYDERERMRRSKEAWASNDYPLVDRRLNRHNVIDMAEAWFPGHTFPRSACTFCPYHSNEEWRRLRDTMPEEFASAIEFDEATRKLHSDPRAAMRATVFIHRDGVPLKDADLSAKDEERNLFGIVNECEGMCGV